MGISAHVRSFLVLFLVTISSVAHAAEELRVDTELVVLIDVSGSISTTDYHRQVEIIQNAFTSPNVMRTIQENYHQRVAVLVIEFSGYEQFRGESNDFYLNPTRPTEDFIVTIPWFIISTERDVETFISLFPERRSMHGGSTHTARAIRHSLELMRSNMITSTQRVINVFTDGHSSSDRELREVIDRFTEDVSLNLNSIVVEPSDLSPMRRDGVLGNLYAYAKIFLRRGSKGRTVMFDDYQMEELLVENFSIEMM